MYAGTIVEMGPATQVFTSPVHPYTAALLAASPSLRGPKRRIHGLPGAPPSLVTPLPGCSFSPRCGCADQVCRDSAPSIAEQRDQLTAACWHPLPVHTGNGHDAPGDISSAAVPGVAVLGVHRESDRSNAGNGPIVEVSHADKQFNAARGFFRRSAANVHAVDDASFEVRPGEALGIVGESGSGKTTLGPLLVQLNDATSGRIRVQVGDGLEAMGDVKRRTLRRHVQMIFQDPYESLNPRMTIGDIIAEPLDVLDLQPRATRAERVARMLERVGLSPPAHFLNRYPHELSGGQRQRVAIARAMVVEPRFVVADEPTSMLDVSVRAGIMELLLDLKRDLGVSYLYITHDLSVARYVCDRIAVMYRGKIVEIGESEELLQSPLHPYTRALIASVPVPDPTYRRPDPKLKRATSTDGAEDHCRFLARCPIASSRCAYEPHPALTRNTPSGHLVSCYEAAHPSAITSLV
jgi:peptide/nickel transport system ATP-binding protein